MKDAEDKTRKSGGSQDPPVQKPDTSETTETERTTETQTPTERTTESDVERVRRDET